MKKIPTITTLLSSTDNRIFALANTIANRYGISPNRILAPQMGYRNQSFCIEQDNQAPVNLIIYKSEPQILARIRSAHNVTNFLHARNWATRHTVDPRIMKLTQGHRTTYAALYNYLPGQTIPWEGYTRRHIKLLGKAMGEMHADLENTRLSSANVINEYRAIIMRMERYFSDEDVVRAMREKLGITPAFHLSYFKKLLTLCELLPQQTLHMDFVRGNILFDGAGEELHISGILDFEKTAIGPRLFDIARTLAFLLVDCKYVPEDKVRKYFLFSGYEKRGKHTISGKGKDLGFRLLESLVNLFLIYDFYKFLRHNPYEYLLQNEHFIRTVHQLQKRQRLSVHKAYALRYNNSKS